MKIHKKGRPTLQEFLSGQYHVEPFKDIHIVDISRLKRNTRVGKAVNAQGIGKAILDKSNNTRQH